MNNEITKEYVNLHIHELGNEFYRQYSSLVAQFVKRAVEEFDLDTLGIERDLVESQMLERLQEMSSVYGSSYDKYMSGERNNYLILPHDAAVVVSETLESFAYSHSKLVDAVKVIDKYAVE